MIITVSSGEADRSMTGQLY